MTQKYDKHEHATWIATRKARRSAGRAAIARGVGHLILALGLLVAALWASVGFFRAFGWPAGAVPAALSTLVWCSFTWPRSARMHGPVLSLFYAFEPDHKKNPPGNRWRATFPISIDSRGITPTVPAFSAAGCGGR